MSLFYSRGSVCRSTSSLATEPRPSGRGRSSTEERLNTHAGKHDLVVVDDSEDLLKWRLSAAKDFRQEHVNNYTQ
jgi:hypothetical protein